jgi:orotate phosphoribosyltransferase
MRLKESGDPSKPPAMEDYKKRLALTLAETGALFFDKGLVLKDTRPTPYFVNMGMFRTGRLSMEMGAFFADMMVSRGIARETDIILGPSYKGSAIAHATAMALYARHGIDLLFDYDRKEAKTHGEVSIAGSLFVNRTFYDGCRVFIVDDVATSMGTKVELIQKVQSEQDARKISIRILGIGIAVDREQTAAVYDEKGRFIPGRKGGNAIAKFVSDTSIPVYAVAGIREIVHFLSEERTPLMIGGERMPLDPETLVTFHEYMETYGIS